MLVGTPFGQLACTAGGDVADRLSVHVAPVTPNLPPGMTLRGCIAIVWRITAEHALASDSVTCAWLDLARAGSAASGEGVDIMTWELGDCAVALGTEDADALRARGRRPAADGGDGLSAVAPVEYLTTGFRVHVTPLAAGESASGHFVLAWTAAAQADSAWFAVDWSHATVLAAVERSRTPRANPG